MQCVPCNDMNSIEKFLPAITETEPAFITFLRNIAKHVQRYIFLEPMLIVLRIFSISFHQ